MKKFLVTLMIFALVLVTGCTKVEDMGDYKEGTYFGTYTDNYGGSESVATAVVYVDETGNVKSVFLDTTHVKDGINTTKKTLGDDYNMKVASPIGKEWHEQVKALEDKIVAEQGLDWLEWSDEDQTETDSVSGVTMKINALYRAVEDALNLAK
ncbi:MAG TPA: FMN-binding protein [Mollicutes bacterium]|jgi:major membrane immunogen (membrane-anchored lipoprotein)|nr:FMN-binding protein [Mollicutes bacterium]